MRMIVFLGPTLSCEEAVSEVDASFLPPVSQGDVYRATLERPFAIGIIDGYFERVPAVWHKEILWAITQRIHVFGASSMGALRAAELSRYGMIGIGKIFDAYNSGELEDDDEVAVAHGDASSGYLAVSEAMVNIRATLKHAVASGVIDDELREYLEKRAKSLFYLDRTFSRLYRLAAEGGVPADQIEKLRQFVGTERVNQKQIDAVQMLRAMRECCEKGEPPPPAKFSFAHTEAWDQVIDWAETQPPITLQSESSSSELVAAEVRLLGARGDAVMAKGFSRVAASVLARKNGVGEPTRLREQQDRLLRDLAPRNSGEGESGFETWLQKRGLTKESYHAFLGRETQLRWFHERYRDDLDRHIVDELRRTGQHAELDARAREKEAVLQKHRLARPTLDDAGIDQTQLFEWYFEYCLHETFPIDLEEYVSRVGLADVKALEHEALREYLFQKLSKKSNLDTQDASNGPTPKHIDQPDPIARA